MTATIVASTLDDNDQDREQTTADDTSEIVAEINEEINEENNEDSSAEALSAPETNQRNGSTWLIVAIALVVGFALGAGYVSYRSSL